MKQFPLLSQVIHFREFGWGENTDVPSLLLQLAALGDHIYIDHHLAKMEPLKMVKLTLAVYQQNLRPLLKSNGRYQHLQSESRAFSYIGRVNFRIGCPTLGHICRDNRIIQQSQGPVWIDDNRLVNAQNSISTLSTLTFAIFTNWSWLSWP